LLQGISDRILGVGENQVFLTACTIANSTGTATFHGELLERGSAKQLQVNRPEAEFEWKQVK
jgi:hypothetical protein